jgi:beta-lactamase regulating signal transducer with metallopeptidase domain
MNSTFQLWIEIHLWPWLGDIAWQSTTLLLVTLLAVRCLRQRSASLRYGVLVLGIAGVTVLTALSPVMPTWSFLGSAPTVESRQRDTVARTVKPSPAAPQKVVPLKMKTMESAQPSLPQWADIPVRFAPSSLPVIVVAIWIVGIAFGITMLALSTLRLRRLRTQAATHRALLAGLERARKEAGLPAHSVRLLVSTHGAMPMMWGWRRATVLLPREAERWTRERLDFVLRHELAHAVRGDAATSLGCWIAMLPFWWHPLAWVALRMQSQLREEACDELVVTGLDRSRHNDYAATLVHVIAAAGSASRRTWLPALAMASTQARSLRARLEAIVDEHRDRRPFSRRGRACALGSLAFLTMGLSMLSACRETSKPATGITGADGSRTYFLTDKQWMTLTKPSDSDRHASTPPSDPFSPGGVPSQAGKEPPITTSESLSKLALRIRTHLLEAGVMFTEAPDGEVLVLKDERTMRVWADDTNHERIAKMLLSGEKKNLVRIVCHAFAVPMDANWLEPLTNLRPDAAAKPQSTPGVTAALSSEETDTLIQRIQSDKACSLFAAPTIVTASGQRATIENIREFIYPTEFDLPQVPKVSPSPQSGAGKEAGPFPITPTTPTAFEMRPVGFRFEVDTVVDASSRVIDLSLAPEWTVFEGFVNYGAPIYASGTDSTGKVIPVEVTANTIRQPLFRTSKLTTSLTIHDGDSVVLGGFGEPPGADLSDPKASAGPSHSGPTAPLASVSYGAQGDATGDLNLQKLPPISKVDRAVFFIFQAKIVD